MPSICFYLHIHQPFRIKKFSVFDIGKNEDYFDETKNKFYLERIIKKSYEPTNKILLDLIKETKGKFKVSFSLTGTFLEQIEKYYPSLIKSFQKLINTGCVEILAETYYHSLAFLYSKEEFKKQVLLHNQKIRELFGAETKTFRNTELIFNNEMADFVNQLGYQAILAEGVDHLLGWRSPNFVYRAKTAENLRILLRNYRLSDDISFRFSNNQWLEWPLTADRFSFWINQINSVFGLTRLTAAAKQLIFLWIMKPLANINGQKPAFSIF